MKAAILGNGPSKAAYSNIGYDLILGCNIPWTQVDFTVITDDLIVWKILRNPSLIDSASGIYLPSHVHRRLVKSKDAAAKSLLNKDVRSFLRTGSTSTGHSAAQIAIHSGASSLWIFGCDSYFSNTVETCTPSTSVSSPDAYVQRWRKLWQEYVNLHPNVSFNFVRGPNDYTTAIPTSIS